MACHKLPRQVILQEEGPREGFQGEGPIAVADKIRLIDALAETGLKNIQCVSFVDARRVPQMADAEEVVAGIRPRDGMHCTGMWLNAKGFDRALASGIAMVPGVICSVSDAFSRKNNGCGADDLIGRQGAMLERYREADLKLQAAHVMTAFACQYEGVATPADCLKTVELLLAS
jgi:hydroxymethylglutaryl-CoA lyase